MIYTYSENGIDGVLLYEEEDGVRIGVSDPDGTFTCPLSKTGARALAKRIVELVGEEPR